MSAMKSQGTHWRPKSGGVRGVREQDVLTGARFSEEGGQGLVSTEDSASYCSVSESWKKEEREQWLGH